MKQHETDLLTEQVYRSALDARASRIAAAHSAAQTAPLQAVPVKPVPQAPAYKPPTPDSIQRDEEKKAQAAK